MSSKLETNLKFIHDLSIEHAHIHTQTEKSIIKNKKCISSDIKIINCNAFHLR